MKKCGQCKHYTVTNSAACPWLSNRPACNGFISAGDDAEVPDKISIDELHKKYSERTEHSVQTVEHLKCQLAAKDKEIERLKTPTDGKCPVCGSFVGDTTFYTVQDGKARKAGE